VHEKSIIRISDSMSREKFDSGKSPDKIEPEFMPVRNRILGLARKFGIQDIKKGGALATALGVHNALIKRLIDKTSFPGLKNLIRICKQAEVSSDYLLFGKEAPLSALEDMGVVYESRQPAPVDLELISQVVAAVLKYLQEHRLKLGPRRIGDMISRGYEDCITEKTRPENLPIKEYLVLTRQIRD